MERVVKGKCDIILACLYNKDNAGYAQASNQEIELVPNFV